LAGPSGNNQPDLLVTSPTPAIPIPGSEKSTAQMQSFGRHQPMDSMQPGTANPQAAGPVKEISIRVQSSSGETVHLRVVDQISQVQVGVRSSNTSLASSLRQDLSSLTATLDRLGWKSEVTAAPTQAGAEVLAEAGSAGNDQPDASHSQAMDWWNEAEHNRRSPSELWEEALNRQTP
jgi:hypothetical protein